MWSMEGGQFSKCPNKPGQMKTFNSFLNGCHTSPVITRAPKEIEEIKPWNNLREKFSNGIDMKWYTSQKKDQIKDTTNNQNKETANAFIYIIEEHPVSQLKENDECADVVDSKKCLSEIQNDIPENPSKEPGKSLEDECKGHVQVIKEDIVKTKKAEEIQGINDEGLDQEMHNPKEIFENDPRKTKTLCQGVEAVQNEDINQNNDKPKPCEKPLENKKVKEHNSVLEDVVHHDLKQSTQNNNCKRVEDCKFFDCGIVHDLYEFITSHTILSLLIFCCVFWAMRMAPTLLFDEYVMPIVYHWFPNRNNNNIQEAPSFWRKCFDYLFAVTYTLF